MPTKLYVTATEALTWLGFGQEETWEQVVQRLTEFIRRWHCTPPADQVQTLIEAVAKSSCDPTDTDALDRASAILVEHEERLGRTLSYPELAAILRLDLAEYEERAAKWTVGNARLRDAIALEKITAWGVRKSDPRQELMVVPPQVASRAIQFRDNRIEPEDGATHDDFAALSRGEQWSQVRFKTAEIALLHLCDTVDDTAREAAPKPFPEGDYVSPWAVTCWRAFGTLSAPSHIERNRSFDHGTDKLPDARPKQLVLEDEIYGWLLKRAEEILTRTNGKPKKAVLVKECVDALKCRYEDAEACHVRLPSHLRRGRGQSS